MNTVVPNLRRLIEPAVAGQLLAAFAENWPGSEIMLLDAGGQAFAQAGGAAGPAAGDHDGGRNGCGEPVRFGEQEVGRLQARGALCGDQLRPLATSLSLLMAQAQQTRDMARETLERYREINLLYRIGATIGACLDPDEVPRLQLEEARTVLRAELGLVLPAPEEEAAGMIRAATIGDPAGVERLRAAAADLTDRVQATGQPDIARLASGPALAVPLAAQGRVVGVTLLGRGPSRPMFTAGDEKLALALAEQVGMALERAWLHRQEIERNRLEEELAVGRRIQLSLLPRALPSLEGWEFAAVYRPAHEVGGDFYGLFPLAGGAGQAARLALFIGDITGKGVPAALMMAYARAILRSEGMSHRSPAAVLKRTNEWLLRDNFSRLMLTVCYATLEPGTGWLRYASGGHEHPLWWHAATGEWTELSGTGTILGAFNAVRLNDNLVRLEPGDMLVMYTDGVTDRWNEAGEMFGTERLWSVVRELRGLPAQQAADRILAAANAFGGEVPPEDDFTLLVVRRQPRG